MHERNRGRFPPWAETKEIPKRGKLYFLWHSGTEDVFSGYGLVAKEGFRLFGTSQGNHKFQGVMPPHLGFSSAEYPNMVRNKCSPCEIPETQDSKTTWWGF